MRQTVYTMNDPTRPHIDQDAKLRYALRKGVRQGPEHDFCFHMLAGAPCDCESNGYGVAGPRYPIWMDHATWWEKDGEPYSVVFQPYVLQPKQIAALEEWCQDLGLQYRRSEEGWWNPGRTVMVEVTRAPVTRNQLS